MNLMLVDNQTLFREGLVSLLQGLVDDLKVAEAGSLEEALRIADGGSRFDAVLIEPLSPGMNGYEGIKALRSYLPDTPIIVISANAAARQVRDAIECGAKGYVTKKTSGAGLVGALRLVLEGAIYVPPSVLDQLTLDQAKAARRRRALRNAGGPAFRNLTPRQRDVLELLAQGQSTKRIAAELGIAKGTVRIHVTAILMALGISNRTEAAIPAARLLHQRGTLDDDAGGPS
jgi:DNA-binding NarL/FixJ family response regulator